MYSQRTPLRQNPRQASNEQRATSNEHRTTNNEIRDTSNKTGDHGSNKTLARIKAKIESAKRYPRLAKKMKIEGRPTVLFEINPDGSLKYVKITDSSGENIIDNAALETVQRAAPLPYYNAPIRLAIRYELKQ